MTERPLLRDVLKDEWGFDGVVDVRLVRRRARPTAAGNAGAGPRDARARRARGATRWSTAVRDGAVSEAAVDDKVLRLLRLAARVGALDGVEPAAPPARRGRTSEVAAELRATAAAGFVLARNDGALLPLAARHAAHASRCSARTPPSRGRSAAAARPSSRPTPSRRSTACAPRWRRRRGRRTRPACARTRGSPSPPPSSLGGVEVRFLAADGTVLGAEQRRDGAFTWLGSTLERAGDGRGGRGPRDAARRGGRRARRSAAPGVGRYRLDARRRARRSTRQLELPPGADPVEAHHAPAAARRAGHARRRARRSTSSLRHEPRRRRRASTSRHAFQLNVEPPHGRRRRGARARRRAGARRPTSRSSSSARPRRSRARASTATRSRCPAARTSSCARVAAANPRTVVVVNAGAPVLLPWADEVPAVLLDLVPRPGVRQRARRRAARRRRARRAAADHLAGVRRTGCRRRTPGRRRRSPTTRACSIGYRAYDRDGRSRCSRSATASATRRWEYLELACDGRRRVQVRVRNTGDAARAARSCRSTRRGPTARSSARRAGSSGFAVGRGRRRARRRPCASRCRRAASRTGTRAGAGRSSPALPAQPPAPRAPSRASSPS